MAARYILLVLSAVCIMDRVHGHGMVLEPPNRSSLWRYKEFTSYHVPINYQDNENFCGGASVQHGLYGGKCGVCGDDYGAPTPRDNENGGKYGLGVISREYHSGANIQVIVRVTASHLGKFNFWLCNLDEFKEESEECFEKYPLKMLEGSDNFVIDHVADYPVYLTLPEGLTCEQCVLRWQYTAGNSWGVCEDGTGALGCGAQETFRTCSDIKIIPKPQEGKRLHVKDEKMVFKKAMIKNLRKNSLRRNKRSIRVHH